MFLLNTLLVAEIATNMIDPRGLTRLFYPEGDAVVAATCTAGETLFDRSSCRDDVRKVPAAELFALMAAEFGGGQAALEAQLGSAETGINRVDARIFEVLAVAPGTVNDALQTAVAAAQAALAAKDAQVRELDDQIARAKAQIAQHDDPELRAQLQLDEGARGRRLLERSALADKLLDARDKLMAAGVAADPELFEGLKNERQRLAGLRSQIRARIDVALDEGIRVRTLFARLRDEYVFVHLDFPVVYRDSNLPVYGRDSNNNRGLDYFFRQLDLKGRTFLGDGAGAAEIGIDVGRPEPLQDIQCSFAWEYPKDPACSYTWIDVTDPQGRQTRLRGPSFRVNAGGHADGAGDLDPALFRGRAAAGHWRVALGCVSGTRPKPMPASSCSIVLK